MTASDAAVSAATRVLTSWDDSYDWTVTARDIVEDVTPHILAADPLRARIRALAAVYEEYPSATVNAARELRALDDTADTTRGDQ